MSGLSFSQKEKIIRRAFWDRNMDAALIKRLLYSEPDFSEPLTASLYARVLQSISWYTLIKVFDKEMLLKLLDERVLKFMYPKELKAKYQYARRILSQ